MSAVDSQMKSYISDLFEDVISRDLVFGSLLRQIKMAYDAISEGRNPPLLAPEIASRLGSGHLESLGLPDVHMHVYVDLFVGLPAAQLKIYSDMFDRVIERNVVFGSVLQRIKDAYDSFLKPIHRHVVA